MKPPGEATGRHAHVHPHVSRQEHAPRALVVAVPKSEAVASHDRAVGRAAVVVVAVVAVTALVMLVRRLARRVTEERADDALADAFAELDRDHARAPAPRGAESPGGPT